MDAIGLLEVIKAVMFQFQAQQYAPQVLHEAKNRYYTLYQDMHMTCQQYYETFKKNANMLEYCGGVLGKDLGLMDAELAATRPDWELATDEELEVATKAAAWEHVLAIRLLMGSNRA